MAILVFLVLACLFARIVFLHQCVGALEPVRIRTERLVSFEVRRKAHMTEPSLTSGKFPTPRETRCRIVRVAGIVLWREYLTIKIPQELGDHLETVGAQDFNRGFPSRFQA
jgi:hypothetical protein